MQRRDRDAALIALERHFDRGKIVIAPHKMSRHADRDVGDRKYLAGKGDDLGLGPRRQSVHLKCPSFSANGDPFSSRRRAWSANNKRQHDFRSSGAWGLLQRPTRERPADPNQALGKLGGPAPPPTGIPHGLGVPSFHLG